LPVLRTNGNIPEVLDGRLLRIGPNPVTPPDATRHHWFAATGMAHGLRLRDGKAEWYRSRFVKDAAVSAALGHQPIPGPAAQRRDRSVNTNFTRVGKTVVDLIRHPRMFERDHHGPNEGVPVLVRWTLDRIGGQLSATEIDTRRNEFPRINGRFEGQPYRYAYTAHWGENVTFGPARKHDMLPGTSEVHEFGPGRYPVTGGLNAAATPSRLRLIA
jgi:carotenoid cleavage dioxygenase-like enzyme